MQDNCGYEWSRYHRVIPDYELTRVFIKPTDDWRICHTDTFDWCHPTITTTTLWKSCAKWSTAPSSG